MDYWASLILAKQINGLFQTSFSCINDESFTSCYNQMSQMSQVPG